MTLQVESFQNFALADHLMDGSWIEYAYTFRCKPFSRKRLLGMEGYVGIMGGDLIIWGQMGSDSPIWEWPMVCDEQALCPRLSRSRDGMLCGPWQTCRSQAAASCKSFTGTVSEHSACQTTCYKMNSICAVNLAKRTPTVIASMPARRLPQDHLSQAQRPLFEALY